MKVALGVSNEVMDEIFAQWAQEFLGLVLTPMNTKKAFIMGLVTALNWIEKPEDGETSKDSIARIRHYITTQDKEGNL